MQPIDVKTQRSTRWVLPLAILGLAVWPLSWAWLPAAGHNPDWVIALVPIAEMSASVLAVAAIWLGTRAAGAERHTRSSDLGLRLGMVVVVLVIGGNLLGEALFR